MALLKHKESHLIPVIAIPPNCAQAWQMTKSWQFSAIHLVLNMPSWHFKCVLVKMRPKLPLLWPRTKSTNGPPLAHLAINKNIHNRANQLAQTRQQDLIGCLNTDYKSSLPTRYSRRTTRISSMRTTYLTMMRLLLTFNFLISCQRGPMRFKFKRIMYTGQTFGQSSLE